MMTFPLVRLVDTADPAATVRYDFNDRDADAERWVPNDGFTLGAPTLDADPATWGAIFGYRSPMIPQRIRGSKQDALRALSALSREALQRTGWLFVQLAQDTPPGWLRIYRSGYEPLSLDRVYVDPRTGLPVSSGGVALPDTWQINVPFLADPFVYGQRVTLPTYQVVQGPTDLGSPTRTAMRVVLPAIKGDAPTPLRVTLTPTTDRARVGAKFLVGCLSGETTMTDPVKEVGTGDGFAATAGTTAPVTGSTYFGGSYRTLTLTSGSTALASRLSGNSPSLRPGRYKVMARIVFTTGGPWVFRLGSTGPVTSVDGTEFEEGWVDLREIAVGAPVPSDVASPSVPVALDLWAGTTDGSTGTANIDAFKFIPVQDADVSSGTTLLLADFDAAVPPTGTPVISGTFDGEEELYYALTVSTGEASAGYPVLRGAFPVADPAAARNTLLVMALSHGSFPTTQTYVTDLNSVMAVDVSYRPKWLHFPGEA